MIFSFRKIFILLFLIGYLPCRLLGQNKYLDSLKKELTGNNLTDTARFDLLINLGDNIANYNAEEARQYYMEVYNSAKNKKRYYYMGSAMSGLGSIQSYQNNDDSALYFYGLADSLFQKDTSDIAMASRASIRSSLGQIERDRNNYEKAISNFLDAINILEKSTADNKWNALGNIYLDVGSVYHDLSQFDKALAYDLKGLEAHKKNTSDHLFTAYTELYVAADYVNLNQLDSAKLHLKDGEMLAAALNSPDLYYELYSGWGVYYKKSAKYDQALLSYQKALPYAIKTGRKFREMDCHRMMGFIYRDMKKYAESATQLEKALSLVKEINNKNLEAGILKSLARAESELGNSIEATHLYQEYINLNDSLNEQESKKKINEIENKYQAEKKEAFIIALQKDNQIQKSTLAQRRTLNFSLIAGCILLLFVALLFYKNFKNKSRLIVQSEKLHQQQLSELETERKLEAAEFVMKGQEDERSRLAKDLHDGVGGLLSGVKLSMSNMKGNVFLSEENAHSFSNVISQLDQSIAELRRVSHNMMPEALVKFGLKEALENYCENLNLSRTINIQLQTYGMENRMDQSTEIVIYRMIQELLNNVIKHADAKNVLIQLSRDGDHFNLTVEDDGKGFDVNENKSGAGLANIRARAEYLDGSVDIISSKGEGTSVNVEGRAEG